MNQTNRRNRSSRIVTPLRWVSSVETWMIERGMSGAITDSWRGALPFLPVTKYADRYAAATLLESFRSRRSVKPKPYCGANRSR